MRPYRNENRKGVEAYRYAGQTTDSKQDNPIHEPTLVDGKVVIGPSAYKLRTADLLSEDSLALLIAERDAARKRLKEARETMNRLGMTNIG